MTDAVVVGSGPNGLAAALLLADHGLDVTVVEAADEPGGAARTGELTLPGVRHDLGSAVHPLALGSPFLSRLPLEAHGLGWIHPPVAAAHPLGGERAALLLPSLEATAHGLGRDGVAWRRILARPTRHWDVFSRDVLGPLLRWPRSPVTLARFGVRGLRSASGLLRSAFETEEARALLGGCAAHSFLRLDHPPSAAIGLVLAVAAHAVGWPIPRGGAGSLSRAMVSLLEARGGRVVTGWRVRSLDELPPARAVLLDLTPRQVLRVAGGRLPAGYAERLRRFRYGPGVVKVDWVLDAPIPWSAEGCARAATVHVGGTLEEVERAERAPGEGRIAEVPFLLVSEPTRFDRSRVPEAGPAAPSLHVAWGYTHVPHAWPGDPRRVADRMEARVETFAPGFRDRIRARSVLGPAGMEAWNPNLVGGDVSAGIPDLVQTVARPVLARDPYATPVEGLYLCSASTPPGGGVHGMCGYHAAASALRRTFGVPVRE